MIKDINTLIGTLIWPLVTIFIVIFYRHEIRQILKSIGELLPRVRKGHAKVAGQEIDLELNELAQAALDAADEVSALPPPLDESTFLSLDFVTTVPKSSSTDGGDVTRFLAEAKHSPKLALISLAIEIERTLDEIIASSGLLERSGYMPVQKAVKLLRDRGSIPEHVIGSVELFWDVRNRLIHRSIESVDSDSILRALDSGFIVLRALQAIPLERFFVEHAGVPIFSDEKCLEPFSDATGLILKVVSPGRVVTRFQIFPTTKSDYTVGQQLSWEWNLGRVWGYAWFRDPKTQEIRVAWHSSGEFVGEPLNAIE